MPTSGTELREREHIAERTTACAVAGHLNGEPRIHVQYDVRRAGTGQDSISIAADGTERGLACEGYAGLVMLDRTVLSGRIVDDGSGDAEHGDSSLSNDFSGNGNGGNDGNGIPGSIRNGSRDRVCVTRQDKGENNGSGTDKL